MTKKDNKTVPLRVRVTESEARIIDAAAQRFGVQRSEYVRWAINNSNASVLGPAVVENMTQGAAPPRPPATQRQTMPRDNWSPNAGAAVRTQQVVALGAIDDDDDEWTGPSES